MLLQDLLSYSPHHLLRVSTGSYSFSIDDNVQYVFCRKDLSISDNASRHVADDYPRSLALVIFKIRHALYHHEQDYTAFQLRYTRQRQLHTKVRTTAYRILLAAN